MTFNEIFSREFLFVAVPPRESRLYIPLLVFFGLLLILGIAARIVPVKIKRATKRYSTNFIVSGLLGFLYLFGRYEGLPWLGSRISLVFVFALFVVWMLINTIWSVRYIPKYVKEKKVEERFEKYLPKPKMAK